MKAASSDVEKKRLQKLIARGKCKEARRAAAKLMNKFPSEYYFIYIEAVMTAEDTTGLGKEKAEAQFQLL